MLTGHKLCELKLVLEKTKPEPKEDTVQEAKRGTGST